MESISGPRCFCLKLKNVRLPVIVTSVISDSQQELDLNLDSSSRAHCFDASHQVVLLF